MDLTCCVEKEKINEIRLCKMKKNFLLFEKHSKKIRQATHWEERFAKHISDKILVTRICKRFSKLKNKENNLIKKKWAKYLNTLQRIYTDSKHITT